MTSIQMEIDTELICQRCDNEIPSEFASVHTTSAYWDCSCQGNYIHPKTHQACVVCGNVEEEMPDSHVAEVIIHIASPMCVECQREVDDERLAVRPDDSHAEALEAEGYEVQLHQMFNMNNAATGYMTRRRKLGEAWYWLTVSGAWVRQHGQWRESEVE